MPYLFLAMMLAARVYVADTGDNKLTVIDSGAPAQPISVSAFPHSLAISPDARKLYVTGAANELDVVDLMSARMIHSVPLDGKPGHIAIAPDGRYLYMCMANRRSIDVLDTASLTAVRTIETTGVPAAIVVTPDNTRMLVGYPGGIDVINIRTSQVEFQISLTGTPASIAIDSDRRLIVHRLFLRMEGPGGFDIVDYAGRRVTGKIALPGANTLAVSPNHQRLWATAGDSVTVFSLPDLKRIATIPTGAGADAIAFNTDGSHVFVSNAAANSVSEIDSMKDKEIYHIPTGKAPGQMIAVE